MIFKYLMTGMTTLLLISTENFGGKQLEFLYNSSNKNHHFFFKTYKITKLKWRKVYLIITGVNFNTMF